MTKRNTNNPDQSKGNVLTLVPGTADSAPGANTAARQKKNAKEFLNLEEPICEVAHMAHVVEDLIISAEEAGEDGMSPHLQWAIMHLAGMAKELRSHFYDEDDAA